MSNPTTILCSFLIDGRFRVTCLYPLHPNSDHVYVDDNGVHKDAVWKLSDVAGKRTDLFAARVCGADGLARWLYQLFAGDGICAKPLTANDLSAITLRPSPFAQNGRLDTLRIPTLDAARCWTSSKKYTHLSLGASVTLRQ